MGANNMCRVMSTYIFIKFFQQFRNEIQHAIYYKIKL